MFTQTITIITFKIIPLLFFANPTDSQCLLQTALTPPNFIPIISDNGALVCTEPPGTIATDGCDDVCLLSRCCKEWTSEGSTPGSSIKLSDGTTTYCAWVDCGNVCSPVADREGTAEACSTDYNCTNLSTDGEDYVFGRNGNCQPFHILGYTSKFPFPNPFSPTHIGFGFQVAPKVYVFGSVENRAGCAIVLPGGDNGFWMTVGSKQEMLATFKNPSSSGFHGTTWPGNVANYDQYKMTRVKTLDVSAAVKIAENLYHNGYEIGGNNCLNAVYNVLKAYGVLFGTNVTPGNLWCPSGTSKFSFFAALTGNSPSPVNNWSPAQDINKASGPPAFAIDGCPSTIPTTCGGATQTPPAGSCGDVDFTNCPSCGSLGPTCFYSHIPNNL